MTCWPIFIISLRDAERRRQPLIETLDRLGLDYTVVDAVDGRGGLAPEHEKLVDRDATRSNLARDMTDAEYGCALSHLSVYRRMKAEGLPGAIILEDDAIPGPLFAEFCREAGYERADLIVLDYSFTRVWRFSARPLTANTKSALLSLNPSLNTAYSISASGCAYMIDNALPIRRTADWPCDITKIGARACIPRIVDHPHVDEAESSIEEARRKSFETRYWDLHSHQDGGFETRRARRWLIKRMSRKLA
jgi:glycosyl transferase family 25